MNIKQGIYISSIITSFTICWGVGFKVPLFYTSFVVGFTWGYFVLGKLIKEGYRRLK